MSQGKKAGCLVAAVAWCVILLILGVAYKFLVAPYFDEKLTDATGSDSRYTQEITLRADSFSGYAILRSPYLRNWLSKREIRLNIIDDGADVPGRIDSMEDGDIDFAVFTIDSFSFLGLGSSVHIIYLAGRSSSNYFRLRLIEARSPYS
ncbi:MAG: hypothetical protein EBU26_13935 [Verrucomicrobia bacterium]|nr:hypothetical protein [Verrucomicrobiota bacterium]